MSITATDKPNYTYGIKLPIPRIERVEIYSTYFNIELGIYLSPTQLDYIGTERFKNYFTFLEENLKVYCMFVRDFKTAEDEEIWSVYDSDYYAAGDYTNRISRILNKDKTIWNYMDGDEYKSFSLGWDYPACSDDAVLSGHSFLPLVPFASP